MGTSKYIKRGINYVLHESKPRNVYVDAVSIQPQNILKDKVVLITGGSLGIGYSIAKRFDQEGAFVIITGRNEERLKQAVDSMKNAIYYKNDVQDISKHDELIDFILKKYNKIDILINNAGVSHHESDFMTVSENDFDLQFNINLKGAYFLTQKCISKSIASHQSDLNVIFITSERGSQCDYLPYGLTKVAINSLVQGLSCRFFKEGIRVNAIAPGVTATPLTNINKKDDLSTDDFISGRYFIPEEVAEIALFLASDCSKCISGEIVHCNAGNHLNPWFKNKR